MRSVAEYASNCTPANPATRAARGASRTSEASAEATTPNFKDVEEGISPLWQESGGEEMQNAIRFAAPRRGCTHARRKRRRGFAIADLRFSIARSNRKSTESASLRA
jgi:hypothetical protein